MQDTSRREPTECACAPFSDGHLEFNRHQWSKQKRKAACPNSKLYDDDFYLRFTGRPHSPFRFCLLSCPDGYKTSRVQVLAGDAGTATGSCTPNKHHHRINESGPLDPVSSVYLQAHSPRKKFKVVGRRCVERISGRFSARDYLPT
jgi:hypothetical protein